jgi:Flp pilus assembly protein TadG
MMAAATIATLRDKLRRFAGARDGIAAVEFAIVLPFMLTLYIGGVEVGDGLAIDFKATLAARTVADLASQYVIIDNAAISNILGAASTVVTPYSASGMVVTVSELTVNAQGKGVVQWSDSLNGTARTVGAKVTLPSKLQTSGITLIWGEVTYPYTPSMGYVLTGTINIYENTFFYPRMSTSVARVNS